MDIDSADAGNELACTAYVESIMEHLYASEVRPLIALGHPLGDRQPDHCECAACCAPALPLVSRTAAQRS